MRRRRTRRRRRRTTRRRRRTTMTLSHHCTVAWVTRPERPKGVKLLVVKYCLCCKLDFRGLLSLQIGLDDTVAKGYWLRDVMQDVQM